MRALQLIYSRGKNIAKFTIFLNLLVSYNSLFVWYLAMEVILEPFKTRWFKGSVVKYRKPTTNANNEIRANKTACIFPMDEIFSDIIIFDNFQGQDQL